MNKKTCHLIHPIFGDYEKLFSDVIIPAVNLSGFTILKVQSSKNSIKPVAILKDLIKKATICIAETSTNVPEVWLEIGYALSLEKKLYLLCSEQRQSLLPFDLYNHAIFYNSLYTEKLGQLIQKKLTQGQCLANT